MATQAHCAYCFESLAARLEKRPQLSLSEVEALWAKYTEEPTTTDPLQSPPASEALSPDGAKPAAISRLLPSPATGSSSSLQSASSTPSGISAASSATSISTLDDSPLFVTWNTVSAHGEKRLRGCIGTFEAQALDDGLKNYALTSALDDTRFDPISHPELPTLECAVTLLTNFEPASSPTDWSLGTHGIRISFTHRNRRYGATYLPDVPVEQGWTKEHTLASLMRKAGWSGTREDASAVKVKVVRYQGEKVALGYREWKEWRGWVEEEMADEGDE